MRRIRALGKRSRMIPASPAERQFGTPLARPRWQQELADAFVDPAALVAHLGLDATILGPAAAAQHSFPLRVPRSFVARMRHGDPNDPLLRQVLPTDAETQSTVGFSADPLRERAALAAPGLLHKYHGRALLVTTGACGVHCRYCFRREFPYAEHGATRAGELLAIEAIARDASIREVLLSGGDPWTLSDRRLTELTAALGGISHVERIRVHTRQPIVLPSRVDAGLLRWIEGVKQPLVVVVHANHANEIDDSVRAALRELRVRNVTLLNQSVLLAGVNDSARALADLSEALFSAGVLPYYLHLLDRVNGAAHFDVDLERAGQLLGEVARLLPGYLVPRLAREVPGASAKLTFAPQL